MMEQYWRIRNATILIAELGELEEWMLSDQCQSNKEEIESKLLGLRMEITELLQEEPDLTGRDELLWQLDHTVSLWFGMKSETERTSVEGLFLRDLLTQDTTVPTPHIDDDASFDLLSSLLIPHIAISSQAASNEGSAPLEGDQETGVQGFQSRITLGRRTMRDSFQQFEVEAVMEEVKRRKMSPRTSNSSSICPSSEFWLHVERKCFNQGSVCITTPTNDLRSWKVTIKKVGTPGVPVFDSLTEEFIAGRRLNFPLQFVPGNQYEITVEPVEGSPMKKSIRFIADLTISDLTELYTMALRYAATSNGLCTWFYRTKSPEYFDDIKKNHGDIMRTYIKDNSGDAASPINLRIHGCFFLATVKPGSTTGEPIPASYFGTVRLCILGAEILKQMPNLFFTDFYCMNSPTHQVTLVCTKPGSEADDFCQRHLLPLNLYDPASNPFLHYTSSGELRVSTKERLIVELLITEDLNIANFPLAKVPALGKGSSTPGGICKNQSCSLCNLQRPTTFKKF